MMIVDRPMEQTRAKLKRSMLAILADVIWRQRLERQQAQTLRQIRLNRLLTLVKAQ